MQFPYSRPEIDPADKEAVLGVLDGYIFTQGPIIEQLEDKLQKLFLVKHAVVCSSGTAALHMAYNAVELGPKAGLITSSVTFLATANAAHMCDAPVGFADVDPLTGNVTVDTLKAAVNAAPFDVKAIAVVHLGGRPCSIMQLKTIQTRSGPY